MKSIRWIYIIGLGALAAFILLAAKTDGWSILTGKQAFSNWASVKPGLNHKITAKDLPPPGETPSGQTKGGFGRGPSTRPNNAWPQAPAGLKVELYVTRRLAT